MRNQIYPCFWFDGNAADAAAFYCKSIPNTRIVSTNAMVTIFSIGEQNIMCLNGGPSFSINPSISLFYVCESVDEADKAWNALAAEGSVMMEYKSYPWSEKYGWLQDKYGISWQINYGKVSDVGQVVTPSLLFTGEQQGNAESAIEHYTSIFPRSRVEGIMRYEEGEGDIPGTVKHAQFHINDYVVMAMDSSEPHQFTFNEGSSIVISCDSQDEIDHYWNALTKGGRPGKCGWLKDKFGVSWQVVPAVLSKLISDPQRASRVINAFMKMEKFDIRTLEEA